MNEVLKNSMILPQDAKHGRLLSDDNRNTLKNFMRSMFKSALTYDIFLIVY